MSSLLEQIPRAQELWREFGPRATIGVGLKKLISPVARVGSLYMMECDLRGGLPPVRPIPGVIVREAFLEDIHLLDGIEQGVQQKLDAMERFQKRNRWFVGIDASNGKLANYRWVATDPEWIPELELNIMPQPGQAYVYALYTAPEYRKRGIDSFTRHYTYDILYRTAGIKTIIAYICAENTVSLKAGRKFLKKIGRVWYVSILGSRTRVFWWPNPKMPTLAHAAPPATPGRDQVFDKDGMIARNAHHGL
jgi:GNAT superfamily N-acetyltransferase